MGRDTKRLRDMKKENRKTYLGEKGLRDHSLYFGRTSGFFEGSDAMYSKIHVASFWRAQRAEILLGYLPTKLGGGGLPPSPLP